MRECSVIGHSRHATGNDEVTFSVKNRVYIYEVDRSALGRILTMNERRPFSALNIAKNYGHLKRKGRLINAG